MNSMVSNNKSINVYQELRMIDEKYKDQRVRQPIVKDLIKTAIAAFAGTVFFPIGIICFFYFVNNKNKYMAYFILAVTLAYSNIVILFINLYYLLLEALQFTRMYL